MNFIDPLTHFFNLKLEVIPLLENLEDREYLLEKAKGAMEFAMYATSDSKNLQDISDLWKKYYPELKKAVYND